MSSYIVPDCLVLKIEEHDIDTYELDNSIFVFYDSKNNNFVIRGKRSSYTGKQSVTYSFIGTNTLAVADFLTTVISKINLWSYVFYNYDNLSDDSNDVTYEFLKECESKLCEITGYDKYEYCKKDLMKYLFILKNVHNKY